MMEYMSYLSWCFDPVLTIIFKNKRIAQTTFTLPSAICRSNEWFPCSLIPPTSLHGWRIEFFYEAHWKKKGKKAPILNHISSHHRRLDNLNFARGIIPFTNSESDMGYRTHWTACVKFLKRLRNLQAQADQQWSGHSKLWIPQNFMIWIAKPILVLNHVDRQCWNCLLRAFPIQTWGWIRSFKAWACVGSISSEIRNWIK